MGIRFAWDERKALGNFFKHGVRFEEAATVYGDPLSITIPDPAHIHLREERLVTMGLSERVRLLVVIHCDRGEEIRIISARLATTRERKDYEEGK